MAGLGMVDVSHVACHVTSLPLLNPNSRPHCGYGQVFSSRNSTSYLHQTSQRHQLANTKKRRFMDRIDQEVTASSECCTSSHIRCRTYDNWYISQRVQINHDRFTSRGEGLGRGDRSVWSLSGQYCSMSNFSKQISSSRSSTNSRVNRIIKVRCEGESTSTYGFGNDTVTYSEAGEVLRQGGVDGAEGESVSPITLENSPMNNSVDDGFAIIPINEGLLKTLLIEFMKF